MSLGGERAEHAARFVVRAGGEIKRRLRPSTDAVPEPDGPQPIDDDWVSVGFLHRVRGGGGARQWIERMDLAVTEIPDQQLVAHVTEASWRERQAPGRVERAARGEALQVVAGKIECVHDAVPCTRDIVVPFLILHCKGDKKLAVDCADIERRIAVRHVGIRERVHQRKSAIVDFHLSALEIGRIEERPAAHRVGGDRESFVDGAQAEALALARAHALAPPLPLAELSTAMIAVLFRVNAVAALHSACVG